MKIDHVAIVTPDIKKTIVAWDLPMPDEFQKYPDEGTIEAYIGGGQSKLLLMEPYKEGPYKTSIEKRGPGIHHIAFKCADVAKVVQEIEHQSSWKLTPKSKAFLEESNFAFMHSRSFSFLLELNQGIESDDQDVFIQGVQMPLDGSWGDLAGVLSCSQISNGEARVELKDRTLDLAILDDLEDLEIVAFDRKLHGKWIEPLTELLHKCYGPLAAEGMRYLASHQSAETTADRLSQGKSFLAFHDQRIVGCITLSFDGNDEASAWYKRPEVCFFQQFAVCADYQSRGVGRLLLHEVYLAAKESGCTELALDTSVHADKLIRYYQKKDFELVEMADWSVTNYQSVVLSKTI